MKKISYFLVAILISNFLFAYPITPRPLRLLIMESEYIIRGKVLEVGHIKDKKTRDSWNTDYSIIEVTEVLQGRISSNKVTVYFCAGMICPAPGVYFENEEVLTFIDKREKGEGYEVHALSYGVKHELGEEGFLLYKKRIIEMQDILRIEDEQRQENGILEWLVLCSENKVTRWEGVYELSPESDFMSYYDRNERHRKDIFLDKSQLKRLYNSILKEDSLGYVDMPLVDIVMGFNDNDLLCLLKKGLLNTDSTDLWTAGMIMERIIRLTSDKDLEDIHEQFSKLYFSYDEADRVESQKLLGRFIKKMQSAENKKPVAASGLNSI